MNDITKLTNRYNNENDETINKTNNTENRKPKFKGRGISGYARLISPFAGKRYSLSPRQKKVQKTVRGLIAAGVLAVGISTPLIINTVHQRTNPTSSQTATEETFIKDEVLDSAELKLLECIYGKNSTRIKTAEISYNIVDELENVKSLTVSNPIALDSYIDFKYVHTNFFNKKRDNMPEINSMLDQMIDIHYSENPSQKDLKKLNNIVESLDDMNIKFDTINKSIVLTDDYEINDER